MNLINSISNMFTNVSGNTQLGKLAVATMALVTAYITPIVGLLVTCFVCSTVDMYYGIKVAKKQNRKITSRNNWRGTLFKIRDEFALILMAHLIEYTVLGDNIAFILSGGITVIIALTELWSILENLNTLDPNGPWRSLGKFLKKKGEDYIGQEINLDKNDDTDTVATKE